MQAFSIAASLIPQLPAHQLEANIYLVMPATEMAAARRAAKLMVERAAYDNAILLIAEDTLSEGFVVIANRCFKATNSQYFGYVAQDAFAGRRWLQKAHHAIHCNNKGLLGFNDGKWSGRLASFGLGRREWLQANYPDGDLFCPEYQRHYGDTELTVLAMGNQQYSYDPNAVLIEVDWDKDRQAVNTQDKATFGQRKQNWLPSRIQHPQILEMFN
jgi:hypothetical protein